MGDGTHLLAACTLISHAAPTLLAACPWSSVLARPRFPTRASDAAVPGLGRAPRRCAVPKSCGYTSLSRICAISAGEICPSCSLDSRPCSHALQINISLVGPRSQRFAAAAGTRAQEAVGGTRLEVED